MLTGLWRRRCGEGEATREGVDVSQLRGGMNLSQPMTIYSRAVQVLMNKSVRLGGAGQKSEPVVSILLSLSLNLSGLEVKRSSVQSEKLPTVSLSAIT